MKIAIIALLALSAGLAGQVSGQTVYYVSPAGSDEAAGTSWAEAMATIPAAVAAASAGDEIRVAEGTYSGPFSDYRGLTLRGGYASGGDVQDPDGHPSVVDAAGATGAAVSLKSGSTLDGFTIRGGSAGVRCFHGTGVTISRNTLSGAVSQGIYLYHSSASITGNTIADTGMAIACQGGSSGAISGNTAYGCDWGGISCDASSPEISANEIIGTLGIGIVCTAASNGAIRGNLIYGSSGRGIACVDSSPPITLNRILGNNGGGISISNSNLLIAGNVIADNGAKGVFVTDDSWVGTAATLNLLSNTVAGHYDTGISGATAGELTANVIGNNGFSFAGTFNTVDYNCVFNSPLDSASLVIGAHSIALDPKFASPEAGDYHLLTGSPCADAGGAPGANTPATDIDGDARVASAAMDIGADEMDGAGSVLGPPRLYVRRQAQPGGDGSSWAAAFTDLSDAAAEAAWRQGAGIWVAAGTYNEQIVLYPYTRVYGGFEGNETRLKERSMREHETVIDPQQAPASTAALIGSAAELNGVTIRHAERAVDFGQSSGAVVASKLLENKVAIGEYLNGGFQLLSCLIARNEQVMPTTSSKFLSLSQLTIADNVGGLSIPQSSIYNSIIAFNGSGSVKVATSIGNCVYGNGNDYGRPWVTWYVDPRFVDRGAGDYHLRRDSPIRNGSSDPVALGGVGPVPYGVVDFDGEPRVQNRYLDVGADEVPPAVATIGEARTLSPDESFSFPGLIAATASGEFPGVIHALQPDRTAGAALPDAGVVSRGDRIDIVGRLELVDGRWRIDPDWDYTRSPGLPPLPWSARSDAVSTDRDGDGVRDAGPPTSGLLMKAAGRVTSVDWARHFFYLDDGAGMLDGTAGFAPHTGIRVDYRALTSPGLYSWATVTGIVQWEPITLEAAGFVNGQYHAAGDTVTIPVLCPRDQADIIVHQQEMGS